MGLSADLISQFVKATKDDPKDKKETVVYGTIVYDGKPYVKLDGSDLLTPISTTTDVKDGERVTVTIENHTATVTGNISSPSARTDDVKEIGNQITEFEIVIADKVSTKEFDAQTGRIDDLVTDNVAVKEKLTAAEADIDNLQADNVTIKGNLTAQEADISKIKTDKLDATAADIKFATIEKLEALDGEFHTLESTYADFEKTTTGTLEANTADIGNLKVDKLDAESADLKFANIDFANIGEAAIRKILSDSGLIKNLVVGDHTVTGQFVGVTITGDLIEGETIKAENIILKGDDGVYYRLNYTGGALSGESVVDTKYYAVSYDSETETYTTTSNIIETPNGTRVDGVYTTDTLEVYAANDNVYYCDDGLPEPKYYRVETVPTTAYYPVRYDSETEAYIVPDDATKYEYETVPPIRLEGFRTVDGDDVYSVVECYGVDYNSTTGEYVVPTDPVKYETIPDMTLINDAFTTDGDEVFQVTSDVGDMYYVCLRTAMTGDGIPYYICKRDDFDNVEYVVTSETIENPEGNLVDGVYATIHRDVYMLSDGSYYIVDVTYPEWAKDKLHGSNIAAKTLTADQIRVTDLSAFGATIGGFEISSHSLQSFGKASVDSTILGVHLSDDGQFSIGDANSYIKFHKLLDESGNVVLDDAGNPIYKLDISADSVGFSNSSKSTNSDLQNIAEYVKIGSIVDEDTGDDKPCIELSEDDTAVKQLITNTKTVIMDGENVKSKIDSNGIDTNNLTVNEEFRQGGFVWATRENGNYGLIWKDVSS